MLPGQRSAVQWMLQEGYAQHTRALLERSVPHALPGQPLELLEEFLASGGPRQVGASWEQTVYAPQAAALRRYLVCHHPQEARRLELDARVWLVAYGTLRAGDQRPLPGKPELEELLLRRAGPVRLAGQLLDLGDYPGWVDGPGQVQAELLELRDLAALSVLDAYEEYVPADPAGSEYLRVCRQLPESRLDAWVYRYNRPAASHPQVPDGDWLRLAAETTD